MRIDAGFVEANAMNQLVAVVALAFAGGDKERWVNLTYAIDDEDENASFDSPLFGFLSARGPSSPFATVMSGPGTTSQVGITHRAGQKAAHQLSDAGIELPSEWRVVQDHPRRGLVVEIADTPEIEDLVEWIVRVMDEVNRAPITGDILYEVHES